MQQAGDAEQSGTPPFFSLFLCTAFVAAGVIVVVEPVTVLLCTDVAVAGDPYATISSLS